MKKPLFHLFASGLLLLAAALCLGLLSLWFATGTYYIPVFFSYLRHLALSALNLLPVVLLVFFLWFAVGRAWLAFLLSGAAVAALSFANYFKLILRDDPLFFEDLLLVREAGDMAGKYDVPLSGSVLLAAALILLGAAVLAFCARARLPKWGRLGGVAVVLLLALPVQRAVLSDSIYAKTENFSLLNRWAATQVYVSKGFVYPFLHSVPSAFDTPPEGYDGPRAERMLAAFKDAPIPEGERAHVIAIMLEAYSDFSKYGLPGLSDEVYSAYHALEDEGVTGNLFSNVFAGGTVDTERAFLTGLSDLGSFRAPSNSYVRYFKSQGYAVEGSHPCYEWFYNRRNINENLGFDKYYFLENHYGALAEGGIAFDGIFFPELIALYKERQGGTPLFSFNVTYQGHGPYNDDITWWGDGYYSDDSLTDAQQNILNNYFGSIANTNRHLTELFDYFRREEEPVIVVLFGDHNPWLGDGNSVYQALGINLDLSTDEGLRNYYSTRYLIWANDAAKRAVGNDFTGAGPDLSPCFLMNELFRRCGWEGPAYMQAVRGVMEEVPVLHHAGFYLERGALTGSLTGEGAALAEDFSFLQYHRRHHFTGE